MKMTLNKILLYQNGNATGNFLYNLHSVFESLLFSELLILGIIFLSKRSVFVYQSDAPLSTRGITLPVQCASIWISTFSNGLHGIVSLNLIELRCQQLLNGSNAPNVISGVLSKYPLHPFLHGPHHWIGTVVVMLPFPMDAISHFRIRAMDRCMDMNYSCWPCNENWLQSRKRPISFRKEQG